MMVVSGTQAVGEIETRTGAARVFALLGIAIVIGSYFINAMDRALFPLLLPEVRREYGFNLPEAGLMATEVTVGMARAGLAARYSLARYPPNPGGPIGTLLLSAPPPAPGLGR